MSIRTPLPYSFATNRGTASKLKFHAIDAPMHSASCNKPDLPRDVVCVSNSHYEITYRVQWSHNNWSYTEVAINKHKDGHVSKDGHVWCTGGSPSIEKHNELMDTVKSLHPMVMQLFSS